MARGKSGLRFGMCTETATSAAFFLGLALLLSSGCASRVRTVHNPDRGLTVYSMQNNLISSAKDDYANPIYFHPEIRITDKGDTSVTLSVGYLEFDVDGIKAGVSLNVSIDGSQLALSADSTGTTYFDQNASLFNAYYSITVNQLVQMANAETIIVRLSLSNGDRIRTIERQFSEKNQRGLISFVNRYLYGHKLR